MHVGIRATAVAAVCSLCVGAGVDLRSARPILLVTPTATTRSVTNRAVSLTAFSDLLAAATPQNDAAPQSNSAAGGVVTSSDLIGTVAKLLATPNLTRAGVAPESNPVAAAADPPVDQPVDPPVDQPTSPPAADDPAPPTNFPGPRPTFGTPSYFAQLAFAVLHVLALPITVPVQAIIGKAEGVPSVIVAALNDLSSLLGQVPKPSVPAPDTKTTPEDSASQQADKAATKVDSASEKSAAVKPEADAKSSKIERNEHERKTTDKASDKTSDTPSDKTAETPKTEHETKPAEVPAEAPKADPTKVVEPKADPAKAVEPKVDPTKVAEPKVDPAKAVEATKPEPGKLADAKPETKPQPAKPESAGPVKVTRDSLKSTPGETGTTGGAKKTEGSKGAETDSKAPATSTDTKVHEGLKSSAGTKTDKPADKPSTEKSSTDKGASSSEGSSHSSEGKSHTSEGKSHSGSKD